MSQIFICLRIASLEKYSAHPRGIASLLLNAKAVHGERNERVAYKSPEYGRCLVSSCYFLFGANAWRATMLIDGCINLSQRLAPMRNISNVSGRLGNTNKRVVVEKQRVASLKGSIRLVRR